MVKKEESKRVLFSVSQRSRGNCILRNSSRRYTTTAFFLGFPIRLLLPRRIASQSTSAPDLGFIPRNSPFTLPGQQCCWHRFCHTEEISKWEQSGEYFCLFSTQLSQNLSKEQNPHQLYGLTASAASSPVSLIKERKTPYQNQPRLPPLQILCGKGWEKLCRNFKRCIDFIFLSQTSVLPLWSKQPCKELQAGIQGKGFASFFLSVALSIPSAAFPPRSMASWVQSMLKTFENRTVTAHEMHRI